MTVDIETRLNMIESLKTLKASDFLINSNSYVTIDP